MDTEKNSPCFLRDPGSRFFQTWNADGEPTKLENGAFHITFGMATHEDRKALGELVAASDTPYPDLINGTQDMVEVWKNDQLVGGAVMNATYRIDKDARYAEVSVDHQMYFLPGELFQIGLQRDLSFYIGGRLSRGMQGFVGSGDYDCVVFNLYADLDTYEEQTFLEDMLWCLCEDSTLQDKADAASVIIERDIEMGF